jgi:hypothetical protein
MASIEIELNTFAQKKKVKIEQKDKVDSYDGMSKCGIFSVASR